MDEQQIKYEQQIKQETMTEESDILSHTSIESENHEMDGVTRTNDTASDTSTDKKRNRLTLLDSIPLRPYPYFYYRDFSQVSDPDLLMPLTGPGHLPKFFAKMHSILSREEFSHIVSWMPHGRSWRVLKPVEFERKVIPLYFEHAKFSSFMHQANGWGFRRVVHGRDRNTYYHEMFLRGLPHLCKLMKRPGVAVKQNSNPEHFPDLHRISEDYPVPERPEDHFLSCCTLQGAPKARMPVLGGNHQQAIASYYSASSTRLSPSSSSTSLSQENISPSLGTPQIMISPSSSSSMGNGVAWRPIAPYPHHVVQPAAGQGRSVAGHEQQDQEGRQTAITASTSSVSVPDTKQQYAVISPKLVPVGGGPTTTSLPPSTEANIAAALQVATAWVVAVALGQQPPPPPPGFPA